MLSEIKVSQSIFGSSSIIPWKAGLLILSFTCQLLFRYTFLFSFTMVQSSFKLASLDSSGFSGKRFSSLSVMCSIIPSRVEIGSSPVFWSSLVFRLDIHLEDSGSSRGFQVFFATFSVSGKVVGISCFFNLGSSKVSWVSKGIFFVLSSFQVLGLYSGVLKWVIKHISTVYTGHCFD